MTPADDTLANTPIAPLALLDPGLAVQADRRLIRANGRSERFLLIGVTAPTVAPDPSRRRPAVNLGFVLDRSGSMGGQRKLGLARQAVLEATHRLDDPDRFSVVVYDNEVEVVVSSVLASPESRRLASSRLDTVDARGSTDLHGGWLAGCEQVAAGLQPDGVNRVLLLTDGLANVGVTDHDALVTAAHDLRQRGVTTSTFGVGTDFDETLLQGIADAGGGHFYFIGDVAQMRDHITSEVGETLEVVAREVRLELTLPESVRVDSLSPFRVERHGGRATVFLGDLVSGQALTLALRVTFDYGEIGREVGIGVRIVDRDGAFERARPALDPVTLAWTYADNPANDAQPRDRDVDRVVARLFAERAKQEAVRLNRQGQFEDAGRALDGVRRRVAAYAGSDTALRQIVEELRVEAPVFAAAMPEMARKQQFYQASLRSRDRMPDGRSRRQS
ncbi:MAG TPA: VWA domain-containing protein [Candidatus Limnocylindrales bacterium]|jgi:Ca-activated chloride channel family protein